MFLIEMIILDYFDMIVIKFVDNFVVIYYYEKIYFIYF